MIKPTTEFFKSAITEQVKLFYLLKKEITQELVKEHLEKILKEETNSLVAGKEELTKAYDKIGRQLPDLEILKKSSLLFRVYEELSKSAHTANVIEFKKNLYALSTLQTVPEIIDCLKSQVSACGIFSEKSLPYHLLCGIHQETYMYWGCPIDKKEKYLKSDIYDAHKQIIDIFRILDLTDTLIVLAKWGEEAFDPRSGGFSCKIPKELFKYIENQIDFESEGPKLS